MQENEKTFSHWSHQYPIYFPLTDGSARWCIQLFVINPWKNNNRHNQWLNDMRLRIVQLLCWYLDGKMSLHINIPAFPNNLCQQYDWYYVCKKSNHPNEVILFIENIVATISKRPKPSNILPLFLFMPTHHSVLLNLEIPLRYWLNFTRKMKERMRKDEREREREREQ